MSAPTWIVVEKSLPAMTYTYDFGPGFANALALTVEGGGVIVVSPPCNVPDATFAELEEHGAVRALVAPNAYHSMGLAPWRARYPDVPIFAPAQSIKRLEKTTKITGIRPVAEAASLLGEAIELVDMPHYKTGEVLVRWRAEGTWAWFMTDVAFAMPTLPKGIFGTVMKLTKSGPGFRRNAIAGFFMVKDKRALYAWLTEQAAEKPPTLIVPCHGVPLTLTDPVSEVRAALA
jgi:glyoxylase-like metal-dependent hydrolase (beta-lactamase superfamily II)